MKCPFCYNKDTKVIDTRSMEENSIIKRRRLCEKCNERFNTYEKLDIIPISVVKRDMTRESFDTNKLLKGVLLACNKRPISMNIIEQMVEKLDIIPISVVKRDMTRESFDTNKLLKGVLLACNKRPISMNIIEQMVKEIENKIYTTTKKEINSQDIGELVIEKLKNLDPIAYVRFASVYKEFKDIDSFMIELEKVFKDKLSKSLF